MPIIGYKCSFKNIPSISEYIFTIKFNLKYTDYGALKIKNEGNDYFDVADFKIKINEMVERFNKKIYRDYDIGICILSVCKYIVDTIPTLFSIVVEDDNMIDIYSKDEIIEDYELIKSKKDKW